MLHSKLSMAKEIIELSMKPFDQLRNGDTCLVKTEKCHFLRKIQDIIYNSAKNGKESNMK